MVEKDILLHKGDLFVMSQAKVDKYKAEKALVEYEISEGLRNSHGIWTGLRFQY